MKAKNQTQTDEVIINGVAYVPKGQETRMAETLDGKPFVLIRTYSAGVHFGYLVKREGKEVKLIKSRRVYYWKGASSLSQMAMEGVKNPSECKFAMEVEEIELTEAIEVIMVTEQAKENLQNVPVWKN